MRLPSRSTRGMLPMSNRMSRAESASRFLPRGDEAVEVLLVEQHAAEFAAARKWDADPRQDASGVEVPDGPGAHSEVQRSRRQVEQPGGDRAQSGHRRPVSARGIDRRKE